MKDFGSLSPLRILEKSGEKGLGRGNLGVLIARAGVGKTACLIHFALDKLLSREKLVHVSLEDGPEKVTSYYRVIYSELIKALEVEDEQELRMLMEHNRMILAFLNRSFDMARLRQNLLNLAEKVGFRADCLIVDGLDFDEAGRELFEDFKALAAEFQVEIWFSARSHRHLTETSRDGVPHPCHRVEDLFSLIMQLVPETSGIYLRLLKDHGRPLPPESRIRLDPNTFLAPGE